LKRIQLSAFPQPGKSVLIRVGPSAAQRDEYVRKFNDSVKDRNDVVAKYNDLVQKFEKQQGGAKQ